MNYKDPYQLQTKLDFYHKQPDLSQSFIITENDRIEKCFSPNNVHCAEDVFNNLNKDGSKWAKAVLQSLSKKSPTSLKVTYRQLSFNRTKGKTPEECWKMEFKLMKNMLLSHDFAEGVRAAVVDKDNKPIWEPKTLDKVTEEMLDHLFNDPRELEWD